MLINILRVMLTRSFKPFVFHNNNCDKQIDYDVPNLGLYVHVPFCKMLCPFCPYYKIKYDVSLASKYVDALIKEIHLKSSKVGKKRVATSLYFSGGSPSLIINLDCPANPDTWKCTFSLILLELLIILTIIVRLPLPGNNIDVHIPLVTCFPVWSEAYGNYRKFQCIQ